MNSYHMPGDAEAQGAIAGIKETYGAPPPTTFRKGDRVTFYRDEKPIRGMVVSEELPNGSFWVSYDYPGGPATLRLSATEIFYF